MTYRMNGSTLYGESADLSIGGTYLASELEVKKNMELTLAFTLQEPEEVAISSKGRVAWLNGTQNRRKPSLPAGFGVEFIEIPDYAYAAVKTFVETRKRNRSGG